MNYQNFSELFSDLDYRNQLEWTKNIYVLLLGDKDLLPRSDPNYKIGSDKPRIEQHIKLASDIYTSIYMSDDSMYTYIQELEFKDFNLLEEILDLVGFSGSYSQYKEIRNILKSRILKDEDETYLILYFFVDDLLEALKSNNLWVRLAGKYENDPHYDEVLAHIEEYRKELDSEELIKE